MTQDGPALTFVGVFDDDVAHPDLGDIRSGTISYEYYWLDRWYSIFCFYEPDGSFRNYYCNINMPPAFENGVLDYVDLDIDVLVWPDLTYQILDEAEYKGNAQKFSYPESVTSAVAEALAELLALIENRKLPIPEQFLQQMT